MNDNNTPIALSLFDRVAEYTAAIVNGRVTPDSPLKQDTSIIVFCQNFFAQFFDVQFAAKAQTNPITGFHPAAQRAAVRLRRSLTGPDKAPTRAVIVQFEKFCETWSDLGAGGYVGSQQEFVEFHKVYIPRLLQAITAWAAAAGLTQIAERSRSVSDKYQAAAAQIEEPNAG